MSTHYDLIVIGAGQGGGPLATGFGEAGKQAAIIEREHVGGTCVNVGCTPTKTMIASGRVAYLARRAADYGVQTSDVSVDMTVVRKRKRDIVDQFRSGSEQSIEANENVTLYRGEARFSGPKSVTVTLDDGGTEELTADTIVIDVGERPASVEIDGADTITVLTSTTVMELDTVPEHLLVLGGGIIGLEFAQLFRRLGAEVTIVHRGEHLLSREDADVAGAMQKVLEDDGLRVLLKAQVTRFSGRDGDITAIVDIGGAGQTVMCSQVLGAIGRISNADSLALQAGGIQRDDKGYIPTDNHLETKVGGVYAIGDVRPGPKFTHVSYDDFRVLRANLLRGERQDIANRQVPSVMYTDPQLGRIGMGEEEAKRSGQNIRVARMPFSSVARARETAETRGMMKAIVDADTGRILGATILGVEGGEILSMIQIAMMGDLPYTALRDGMFAHPTFAESLNNLFSTFDDGKE